MAKIPESIGKYKIESLLAKGGMGAVFKGLHPTLKRPVILKKLTLRGRAAFVKRFEREARILMDFRNENIVDMYDHFKEGTSYYLVLEYVDGISLDALIERERYLPNDAALYVFLETARALKYAHDKNVIHRDIKPANILLSNNGEIKLADFGIAVSGEDGDDGLTKEGMTLGTPSYMAPEQIEDSKNVDKRADIYSLGVMLYEMVSGKKPFPGGNLAESFVMIHKGKYTPVRRHNPKASGFVNGIIKKAMRVKADSRYQDLGEIIARVEAYFRNKDMDALKEHFKEFVGGGTFKPAGKKGNLLGRVLGIVLFSALVCGGLAGFIGYKGYHYELLFRDTHGALVVSARFEKLDFKVRDDIYVKAFVYAPGSEEIKEVSLFLNEEKETPVSYTFESEKVYLPGGRYITEIHCENKVLRGLVFLDPRSIQAEIPSTAVAKRIELTFGKKDIPPLPLSFSYKVRDTFSGEDITDKAKLSISWDGSQWGAYSSTYELTTGRTYWFRATAPGYHTKDDSVVVKPNQTVLDLQLGLVPQVGTAMVFSNYNDMRLQINGSDRYVTIEENSRILKPIRQVKSSEVRELVLFPGEYRITASVGDVKKDEIVRIEPGKEININLIYDKAEKQVDISW